MAHTKTRMKIVNYAEVFPLRSTERKIRSSSSTQFL